MSTTTLLCKQCNFENEPERVYCHNCGAKLDRALLPPEATKRVDPQAVQQRVRSIVRPKRIPGVSILKSLFLSLAAAAVLAAAVLICRPPDNIPHLSEEVVMTAPAINDDMETVLDGATPHLVKYSEDQANAFLQYSIHPQDKPLFIIPRRLERVFVNFDEGTCQVTAQESLFGFSIYMASSQAVTIDNHKLVVRPMQGSLGRLIISPKVMPWVTPALSSLWTVLDSDRKLVARMQSITFHKGTVEMVGGGGAR